MLSLLLGSVILQTKPAEPIRAPLPPLGTNAAYLSGLKDVSQMLAEGKFAEASQRATNLPKRTPTISLIFTGVDKETQAVVTKATVDAANQWKGAIPDLNVTIGSKPDILVEVVQSFSKLGDPEEKTLALFSSPDPNEPALEGVLALNRTSRNVVVSPEIISADIRYVIGQYLGLERTPVPTSSMFRYEGLGVRLAGVDAGSRSIARTTLAQAELLRGYAKAKTRVIAEFPEAFLPDREKDLGTIKQGEPQFFQFEVRNRGEGPLRFSIRPDCSCFQIDFQPEVGAGQVGIVTIGMSTVDFQGHQDKGLYIYTDDPENPVTRFSVKANIRPAYRLIPEDGPMVHTYVLPKDGLKLSYILFSDGDLPFEPRKVSLNGVSGVATIAPWEGVVEDPEWFDGKQPRKGYKISVMLSPSAALGRNIAALVIQTDSQLFPLIAANFYVQRGVAAVPASLFLGDVTEDTVRASIILIAPSPGIKILSAESTDKRLTPKIDRLSDTEYRLTVDFKRGKEIGTILTSVTVKTSDPDTPEILIPVQAYVL